MRVKLRCYGEVADAVGETELRWDAAEGATVEDALSHLSDRSPGFDVGSLSGGLVAMVNGRHADRGTPLSDGDALALSQSPMRE